MRKLHEILDTITQTTNDIEAAEAKIAKLKAERLAIYDELASFWRSESLPRIKLSYDREASDAMLARLVERGGVVTLRAKA